MNTIIIGPTVAIMMHVTFGFWGSETETYVATYRDLETCRARITQLDKESHYYNDPHFYRNHRYCRLEGVVQ